MPELPRAKATQVSSLGESPVEARKRMQSERGVESHSDPEIAPGGRGVEVDHLTPAHIAKIREVEEGFSSQPSTDGSTEDIDDATEPPTPFKAMAMIRQLSQDKLQLQTERDAALNVVSRYKAEFGELEG